MYYDSRCPVPGGVMFYRHTQIDLSRPTLLFIHGLGDCGDVFLEAFEEDGLLDYNIIVPDLLGYGQSTRDPDRDYSFRTQYTRLYHLLDQIGIPKFTLIGHSMGGNIGVLMCDQDNQARIEAFVNIEGDLTQGDRFITDKIIAAGQAEDFESWLRHSYTDVIVPELLKNHPVSLRRYQASLRFCDQYAFLENAREIFSLNENIKGTLHAEIASIFDKLPVRKRFFWGDQSLNEQSVDFLNGKPYAIGPFQESMHWIMLDNRRKFYDALCQFLREND